MNNRFPRRNRGIVFAFIFIAALVAFELFNYATTQFSLRDLLGNLTIFGLSWATILATAFCAIDFAGIARLLTPEEQPEGTTFGAWGLFAAWLVAATLNAMLTWWAVSIAILAHPTLGNAIIGREQLLESVPVFVAVLVWLSRVLLIGTFSIAGERLFPGKKEEPWQRRIGSA